MSLSDALRCCQISSAIWAAQKERKKLYPYSVGGDKRAAAPSQPSCSDGSTDHEALKTIREAYDQLLKCFQASQKHSPGFHTAVGNFLVTQGTLAGVADTMFQLEQRAAALEGQLQVLQENRSLTASIARQGETGAEKRRRVEEEEEQQAQDRSLPRVVRTVDQACQYECPTQPASTNPPRHFMHHSAMLQMDCRPPYSRLQPLDRQLYEKVIVTLRDDWHFQVKMPTGGILQYEDLATLSELNWLNDLTISEYLALICQASTQKPEADLVGVFNSVSPFFIDDLCKGAKLDKLHKFTKRIQLKESQGILFPYNVSKMHWVLFVAYTQPRELWVLDSGRRFHEQDLMQVGKKLVKYLTEWAKEVKVSNMVDTWRVIQKESPQQGTKSDCGVFTAQFARQLALEGGQLSDVRHEDMQHLRRKMIMELFYGRLFPL